MVGPRQRSEQRRWVDVYGPAARELHFADQRDRVGTAQYDVPAPAPAHAGDEGGGRAENVKVRQALAVSFLRQAARRRGRLLLRVGCARMREAQPDEPPERWVAKVAPELDLSLIHRRVVVLAHGLDRVVLRRVRLDDHAAAPGTPPGATGHLLQQLECALGGAEVREAEPGVRRAHADECD